MSGDRPSWPLCLGLLMLAARFAAAYFLSGTRRGIRKTSERRPRR